MDFETDEPCHNCRRLLDVIAAQREHIDRLEETVRLRENPWGADDRYADDVALD